VVVHLIELKRVEESELTRRLGEAYLEYTKQVPMHTPQFWRFRA
jgi:protein-S-isoprenylcysteine O-methyltransferase Ste14